MDKGIRAFARNYFVEQNEFRRKGEKFTGPKGNTEFRKEVMCKLMEEFGCSLASAATHYNEAFKLVKEATPELVAGLGRAEDKKGGRKPKANPVSPEAHMTQEETVAALLESNILSTHVQAEEEELYALQAAQQAEAPQGWDKVEAGHEEAPF